MSLRCVSKCMVGRPRFKVYTMLILGIIFGFSLSTLLHGMDLSALQSLPKNKLLKLVDYKNIDTSKKVEFSNFDESDPDMDLGYVHEYERFDSDQQNLDESPSPEGMFDNAQAIQSPSLPNLPKDVKLKQLEYQNENWQGRNVRQTRNNEASPEKLSEELHTRQSYLVAVITTVTQLMSQTLAIHGTWGPEAVHVVYFVGEVNPMPHLPHGMNVIQLEGIDDKAGVWEHKEYSVMKYLIDNYLETVDWFVLVGDEAYVVTDNLEVPLNRCVSETP